MNNDNDDDNDINRDRPNHYRPTTWLSKLGTLVLLGGKGGGEGRRDLWWRPEL